MNVVLRNQTGPQNLLRSRGYFVGHIRHFLSRTYECFGMAMAIETPLHLQRVFLPREVHLIDSSMATRATNALGDVDTVVEINKVGKVVHLDPGNRLIRAEARTHGLQRRTIRPNLGMAVHTGFRWRNPCRTRYLHRGVTIAAIDAQLVSVVLVAKRNRLLDGDMGTGDVPRAVEEHPPITEHSQDKDSTEYRRAR